MKSRRVSGSPESFAGTLDLTERQTRKLTKLIGELLSVSRIGAARLDLQLEEVDMASVVRDVVERFSSEIARVRSPLTVDVSTPIVGRWDRIRLEQVVTNLLSNATRFGAGRPIEVTVAQDGDTARLVVQDHGIGIPPDRLPRVFERFERGVSVREYGGLGLGLYIAGEIVRAMGGTIRVESAVDVGSTFMVELPRARAGSRDDLQTRAEVTP
jgi:signal transduction histidine kinase